MQPTPDALLRHAELVRRLAHDLLGDESAADDVAQETWVAALEHPPSETEGLRSWLATVARRFALRRIRTESRRAHRERQVARHESDGHEDLAREVLLERVTRAVIELDEPYRTAILLRYYEGLGPTQIAKQLGVPTATVASRQQRALAHIRDSLDRQTEGGRRAWIGTAALLGASKGALVVNTKLKLAASVALTFLGAATLWKLVVDNAGPSGERTELVRGGRADLEELELPPRSSAPAAREAVAVASTEVANEAGRVSDAGALQLSVVWEESGEPATGRAFEFFAWDVPEPQRSRIKATTDELGQIRLDGLAPGTILMYGRLSGGGRVTVERGEVTEVVLRLAAGRRVTGRVVDSEDVGVAGARVWISDEMNGNDGGFVGETGLEGDFSIAGVGPSRYIAAFAPGYTPATRTEISGKDGETVSLTLELGDGGRLVRGVVLDERGLPVANASARVESLRRSQYQRPDGTWARSFAPWEQTCAQSGEFVFDGLPRETVRLHLRAPDRAPATLEIDPAVDPDWLTVTLPPAGVVHGVVRDVVGQLLSGVEIRHGSYADFTSSLGKTRSDGSFRLGGLAVGSVELLAEHADHGRSEITLQLEPGVPTEWNPILVAGSPLVGRVVDAAGGPRPGFIVDVVGSEADPETGALWSDQTTTDADGGFRFASCPDEPLSVEVSSSNPYRKLQERRSVRPGGAPLAFVVTDAELPTSGVRGKLLTADGSPCGANIVMLGPRGNTSYHEHRSAADSGLFEVGDLPPGNYSLRIEPDELPPLVHGEVELAEGRLLDLDELRLGDPCVVRLEVEGHLGAGPFEEVTIYKSDGAGRWTEPRRITGLDPPELLVWPGAHALVASGGGVCTELAEFEVAPGGEATVRLVPDPGVLCRFALASSSGTPLTRVAVSILDGQERGVAQWSQFSAPPGELAFARRLREGPHTAIVNTKGVEVARVPFVVPASSDERTIPLDLP